MKKRLIGVFGIAAVMLLFSTACAPTPETGPVDVQPPQILSVEVSPSEVIPGQPMTITATISDNVGVTSVNFLVGRNGTPSGFCSAAASLVSGTAALGTWKLSCVAPASLNAGTYRVGTLAVDARLNNASTSELSPPAVAGYFTVSGDLNDSEAPVAESVTTSPAVVIRGSQITISAHVTDATGVANVNFAVRQNRTTTMDWCLGAATLSSGSPTDGIWQLTCTVKPGAAAGQYRVNTATIDVLNNFGGVGDEGADAVAGPFTVTTGP